MEHSPVLCRTPRIDKFEQCLTIIYCSWLHEYKMIVKLTYFGTEFEMECAMFWPASTGLDQILVLLLFKI